MFRSLTIVNKVTLPTLSLFSTSANAAKKVSPLGELRKKSGYSLTLCKKALAENDQNVDKAFKWLKEQAQAQGWNKAQKLEGRKTANGLIGVKVEGKHAAMIELNCETDFVARNKQFLSLLQEVSALNIQGSKNFFSQNTLDIKHLEKIDLDAIEQANGKTLADLIALNIGVIGENITTARAAWMSTTEEPNCQTHLIGFTHPSGAINSEDMCYGKYGVLMTLSKDPNVGALPDGESIESLGRQLCQHVIGMNPESVGNLKDPNTWPKSKQSIPLKEVEAKPKDEAAENPYGDYDDSITSTDLVDTSQKEMIHQTFLMDSEKLIRDLLLETGLNIKCFVRYEVGQSNME